MMGSMLRSLTELHSNLNGWSYTNHHQRKGWQGSSAARYSRQGSTSGCVCLVCFMRGVSSLILPYTSRCLFDPVCSFPTACQPRGAAICPIPSQRCLPEPPDVVPAGHSELSGMHSGQRDRNRHVFFIASTGIFGVQLPKSCSDSSELLLCIRLNKEQRSSHSLTLL